MSQSAVPLNCVAIYEPRMELNNERSWVVIKGGQQVTYYPFPSTSFSNSQFNFICNPPSSQTVLDRAIFIEVPYTITFSVNAAISPAPIDNLLQPGRDAFRAFPISSITNTLTATINGFPTNIELSQVIHALSRYHTPLKLKNGWMSAQPSFEDNYQLYSDADGATNNPLSGYLDAAGMSEIGRGAYPFTVVSNTPSSATITGVLREQVFLPPFLWDGCQAGGLSNLTSLTFNWILNNNLARMWSHSTVTDVGGLSTIGAMNIAFSQPSMYLAFLTPRLNQPIPPRITYPYFQISRYTTQTQASLAPNAQATYKSNIIQLDSIPRKLYLYVRQSDSAIYNNLRNQISTPDVFLQINALNLTWNNQQGVLSGASPQNLYDFSVQNGYNKSWTEFNGITQRLSGVAGQPTYVVGLEGGIICIELSKDVGLNDNESEGILGNFNLQVQMTVTNTNQVVTVNPDLYIVAVYDGTLVISNTSAMASIGVVTKAEVLDAPMGNMSFNSLEKIYGGDFFGRFKHYANQINDFLKEYKPISSISGLIPHPIGQAVHQASKVLGYGYESPMERHMAAEKGWETRRNEFGPEGHSQHAYGHGGVRAGSVAGGVRAGYLMNEHEGYDRNGGVLYGGKHLSKAELKRRLNM